MISAETKAKIESLETRRFYIYMTDHWTNEDRKLLKEIETELAELKKGGVINDSIKKS